MNYEDAISEIEGNQRYNVFVLLTFSVLAFITAMDVNSMVFIGYTPTFKCIDDVFNTTNVKWLTKQCSAKILSKNGTNETMYCSKWKFDESVLKSTLVTEFGLVCDKEYYITIMNSLYFVGVAIGNFIGISGDRLGRIKLIQIASCWEIVINILLPFMSNIYAIFVFRFLIGFGAGKLYQGICYLSEIISTKNRSFYTNNYWILYVVGYMLIPGIAYAAQDWRLCRHLMNIPMIFYLFYYFMPESPRWLGVSGNIVKSQKSLLFIAKYNGKKLLSNHFDKLCVVIESTGTLMQVFATKTMRLKVLVSVLVHGTICLSYFGLSINENFISSNIFINVFVQGFIELLTGPLAWISTTKLNRKISLLLYFMITSICLFIIIFFHAASKLIIVKYSFAIIGKFSLTTVYCIMDMYLNEIFPTTIRNMALFIILGIASTFTVMAPTINKLDSVLPNFSNACYSTLTLVSGILIYCLLPETKNCPLPQTMEEGEELRKGNEVNYRKLMKHNDTENKLTQI